MFFKQFYLGCLSHASYLLGSNGIGVVIDPQRDVDRYLEEARVQGLTIRYVIETHLHADFVSGHRELAQRSGGEIVIGKLAAAQFRHHAVRDGDTLDAGALHLAILETPGHTPEGISILVTDREHPELPAKLFTGDTLFIGDVGRPDLSGSAGFTAEQMAAALYDTLQKKILTLDDSVEVYPAHGAGSLCGRNISSETWSTIGAQRLANYALQPMSKAAFVALMTSGLPEAPAYFSTDVKLNREGAPTLSDVQQPQPMTASQVAEEMKRGALVLDVRPSEIYGPEHIGGTCNIGLDGQFASWAGSLLDFKRPIIIVAESTDDVVQAVLRLARVGIASVRGTLQGGIEAWKKAGFPTLSTEQLAIEAFARIAASRDATVQILDVRRSSEFATGTVPGAQSIPLADLASHLNRVERGRRTYVMCGSGYRSSIATSILEAAGYDEIVNVDGGMNAYREGGFEIVEPLGVA